VMIQAGNTAMLRLLQPNDLGVAQEQLTRCKHRPRFPLSPEGDSPQREKFYGDNLGCPRNARADHEQCLTVD